MKIFKKIVKRNTFAVRAEQESFERRQEDLKVYSQCPEMFGLGVERFKRR